VEDSFTAMPFSAYAVSFLSDDLIRLRYVSIKGELRKVLVIIKMRGGAHSREIREYEITSAGLEIGRRLGEYQGLTTGVPVPYSCSPGKKEVPQEQANKEQE